MKLLLGLRMRSVVLRVFEGFLRNGNRLGRLRSSLALGFSFLLGGLSLGFHLLCLFFFLLGVLVVRRGC